MTFRLSGAVIATVAQNLRFLHSVDLTEVREVHIHTRSLRTLFRNTCVEDIFAFLKEQNLFHRLYMVEIVYIYTSLHSELGASW